MTNIVNTGNVLVDALEEKKMNKKNMVALSLIIAGTLLMSSGFSVYAFIICILIAFVLCFCIAVVSWVQYGYCHSSNMLTQEEVRNVMQHVEQLSAKPRKVTLKADRLDIYFDDGSQITQKRRRGDEKA